MPNTRAILEVLRRIAGSLRWSRTDADLAEELRIHLAMAAEDERRGRAPSEAARAARVRSGGVQQAIERVRDQRGLPWLERLAADVVSGARQIVRHRTVSLSVVLSLGLAMGTTMAAFRLVDAVLLRPLPVADPSSLFVVTTTVHDVEGRLDDRDDFDYPTYRRYIAAVGDRADLLLVGSAVRRPIRIAADEPETGVQQFVSGNLFPVLRLRPALGRLLTRADDTVPGGHPVAVISHEFWRRRLGGDAAVIGKSFRIGARSIEIVGVAPEGFTGTEPGALTDFFLPSMMNPEALEAPGWSWFRIWARPRSGVDADRVREQLQARFHADHLERAARLGDSLAGAPLEAYLAEQVSLRPAGAGVSALQKSFRRPLWILSALAALLLLIACGSVANLLLARGMSRRIEMALRTSIGASRGRLIQMMLIESVLLALLAGSAGALFASWAAPFVVSMLGAAERPVRVMLGVDWRALLLGAALTLIVTMLFGIVPAIRASAAAPFDAVKESRDRRGHRRLTDLLVAAQMSVCVFLLFGASLFAGTFARLRHAPLGFTPSNLLFLDAASRGGRTLQPEVWTQLSGALREVPGVTSAAAAGWAPLTGNRWRSSVTVPGQPSRSDAPNWVSVSPGYFETMQTRVIDGREFRPGDAPPGRDAARRPVPGVAIVNEAFARTYFDGRNPVGQRVVVDSSGAMLEIVGLTADAVYADVRETKHPAVFVPFGPRDGDVAILARADPLAGDVAARVRKEVSRVQPDVEVRNAAAFDLVVADQMLRERLLAALSTFFAVLALLLAVMGMYAVLNYAVTRERREIGLRMALGATPGDILALVTTRVMAVVGVGAVVGIAGGFALGRAVRTMLFEMTPADPVALMTPILALAAAAALAALPPVIRAVRIDPAQTIRSEG